MTKYFDQKYIQLFKNKQEKYDISKICIHKYLVECKTNNCPPGLADFLRGTITLYNYAKMYKYEFYLEDNHPIYRYLSSNKNIIGGTLFEIHELLPPLSYEIIDHKLNLIFQKGQSFCIMTNGFYKNANNQLENFLPISQECKIFLKSILTPNDQLKQGIDSVFSLLNLSEPYSVIHL